jgi:4-amino-4-deoxy-L-arabinose transferase-like glycosyltransferase
MLNQHLFLILILLISVLSGRLLYRFITGQQCRTIENLAFALPLGLGFGGLLIGISGTNSHLNPGLFLWLVTSLIALFFEIRQFHWNVWKQSLLEIRSISVSLTVLIGCIIIAWLGIHAPVIDGDALCYHLEVAKRMTETGGLQFDTDLHEIAYPLVLESLQSLAIKAQNPVSSRCFSFLFGVSLVFSTVLIAREFVTVEKAYWAGVIMVSLPIIHCGMISPLNDVPLASLCVPSLAAYCYLNQSQVSIARRVVLAGIFCGLACGVKFPAIIWSAVMLIVILTDIQRIDISIKNRFQMQLKYASLFAIVMLLVGGYWYARAAVLTGNPVHPYFRQTFGGNGLDEVLAEDSKSPVEKILNIISAPVVMSLDPSRFDSFSQQVGPVLLAIIPLGIFLKLPVKCYWLLFIGWLDMAICLTQRQSPRFYLPAFAPITAVSIAIMDQIDDLLPMRKRRLKINSSMSLFMILLCTMVAFNMARVRTSALILSGRIQQGQWLREHEPTAWLTRWADANLPADARLIGQDHRAFYWPRRYTMEKAHRRRLGINEMNFNSESMIRHFRNNGFTHLVMAEPIPQEAVEFDPSLSIILMDWLKHSQPLIDVTLSENDGYKRHYRIYSIADSPTGNNYPERDDQLLKAVNLNCNP